MTKPNMSGPLEAVRTGPAVLTSEELNLTLRQATARRMSLWDLLVVERQVPEDALPDAFSQWLNLPRVRLDSTAIEPAAIQALDGSLARKHTCLPLRVKAQTLVLAMANPADRQAIEDVQFASTFRVQPVVSSRVEILSGIERHYPSAKAPTVEALEADDDVFNAVSAEDGVMDLRQTDSADSSETTSAVHFCSLMVLAAIKLGASDIHIEPGPSDLCVRMRIDGVLRDYVRLPRWMRKVIVGRFKVLAKLDIAQQRLPQDGRIQARTSDRRVDMRLSTLPTHFGEKAVMRLLGSSGTPALDALGLSAEELVLIDDAVSQPQGLVLVTGPTGSGKSTTLYSMLRRRQSREVNIVTIEDPIEYQITGVSQVQVDARAGLTFASCLRAILRQDPDVIMVGEIRDLETAEIAFQAALTGHLVFSTLHTNGSVAAVERLLDLGLKPLLVASATTCVVAQRLARRTCMNCREPYVPSAAALRKARIEPAGRLFLHGRGCEVCGQTGYSGRVGVFEILRLTPRLKDLISRQAPESEIRSAATAAGTRFLLADALDKVRQGLTTIEEVLRVIRVDDADDDGSHQTAAGLKSIEP